MSRSVDLFIDMEPPIEAVVGQISSLTDVGIDPGELPGTWSMHRGGVHAELHAHPYVDDGELLLSRYRWALSCRLDIGVRVADAPETVLLRLVSDALRKEGVATLLVHDLQYLDRRSASEVPSADDDPTGPQP